MKIRIVMFLAAAFLLNACSATTGIEVSSPWARPALQEGNGAVYFLLQNHSAAGDELTGISSDIARAVEIHESKSGGGCDADAAGSVRSHWRQGEQLNLDRAATT